jgi:arsenite methyltransferase
MTTVDTDLLETKVKHMYRLVAEDPHGGYHFEMGSALAQRLGYPREALVTVPVGALESFAGVGFFFDLADLRTGERVVDLGSGSGTDAFVAAALVGAGGQVVGVDFTAEQLAKARRLAGDAGIGNVAFREGRIEQLPVEDTSVDCVISNGVVNLAPDKRRVFAEAARVLRPGGRLAIADIVTERQLQESIVCDADLWASCIGGAAQEDDYRAAVEGAGLRVTHVRPNPYQFLSEQARNASVRYGVRSISLLAVKPER